MIIKTTQALTWSSVMHDMQVVISWTNFFNYILTVKFYNGFQSQPTYQFDTAFFEICWLWRQPNTPSKYCKILPIHNERPYHPARKVSNLYKCIEYTNTTFRHWKKILLYLSVTVPPCCNFAIYWWYHQLRMGGKNIVMDPLSFYIHSAHLILSLKDWFHFTVRVARSRSHLNVLNYFLLYTATYVSYN